MRAQFVSAKNGEERWRCTKYKRELDTALKKGTHKTGLNECNILMMICYGKALTDVSQFDKYWSTPKTLKNNSRITKGLIPAIFVTLSDL